MDTAKRERIKVEDGDCVSLPTSYWGDTFASQMESDYQITKLFGRVSYVNNNNDFSVVWDVDGQLTQHMSLTKCAYEKADEPKQTLPSANESVITAEDFQAADQSTSSYNINKEHALMVEEYNNILSDDECCKVAQEYVLLDGEDEIFQAWIIHTEPGDVVHHKPLQASERKFQITHLLEHAQNWPGYDEDIHDVGTFVAWDLQSTKQTQGKEKVKKKKKFNLRIKGTGDRNLRQRNDEVAYGGATDITTSEDEDVKTLMKK